MSIKTEAIILGSRPLAEADRWYYVLTPQEGKLRLRLKSAGRSSSKLAGHLWPGSRVRLLIGRGRQDHLAGVDVLQAFGPAASLSVTLLQSLVLELATNLQVSGQAAVREYQLLWSILMLIHDESLSLADRTAGVRLFVWSILAISGWQPSFEHCGLCGKVMSAVYYQPQQGFVCADHGGALGPVSGNIQEIVRALSKGGEVDWLDFAARIRTTGEEELWWQLTQAYVRDILEQPLRTLNLFSYLISDVYYQTSSVPAR